MADNQEQMELDNVAHAIDYFDKKNRIKVKSDEAAAGVLNINSLMDIMTIMLVFLLVSITSDPLSIQMSDALVLAQSTADLKPKDSIPITVTKKHLIVDKSAVANIDCKIGGQMCTQDDFDLKARCNKPENNCAADEIKRSNSMLFYVDKSYKKDGSDREFLIEPLHKELERLVKTQKDENMKLGRPFEGITSIIVDKDIPFRLIAEIVHSAGMAELHDFRFAIMKMTTR